MIQVESDCDALLIFMVSIYSGTVYGNGYFSVRLVETCYY